MTVIELREWPTDIDTGATLDAQARYAAGTKTILDNYPNGKLQNPADLIVGTGKVESAAYSGQRRGFSARL